MKFAIPFLLIGMYCFSCQTPTAKDQNSATTVKTDSLVALWNAAWNHNDSAAIVNLMTKDVVFIGDGRVQKGLDSVARKFVGPNSKVLRNLKTELLSSGSCGDQAYYYGTYTHDVALKDTVLKNRNGVFSCIYTLEQNQWKIKLLDISEI